MEGVQVGGKYMFFSAASLIKKCLNRSRQMHFPDDCLFLLYQLKFMRAFDFGVDLDINGIGNLSSPDIPPSLFQHRYFVLLVRFGSSKV